MARAMPRWDPFAELSELRARLDRMFDQWPSLERHESEWTPAIDIVHEGSNLIVRADVPGIKPDEVSVEVEDDVLTISGTHEEHTEEQHKHFVRHERRCGSFSRSMPLPAGVEPKDIKATTHDGIVEVTIPIPEEPHKTRIAITPSAG